MRTLGIVTALPVSESELRQFVIERGGIWNYDSVLSWGDMFRDGSQINLTVENDLGIGVDKEFLDEERELLGFEPQSLIVIGAFRDRDPVRQKIAIQLAYEIASEIALRWKGNIDSSGMGKELE